MGMLILNRRPGETLMIGDDVTVKLLEINGHQARIGVNAPKEIPVHREEIYQRIQREKEDRGEVIEKEPDLMSASEALFLFVGWLTTRAEGIAMSSSIDSAPACELVSKFIDANKLTDPREDFGTKYIRPEG